MPHASLPHAFARRWVALALGACLLASGAPAWAQLGGGGPAASGPREATAAEMRQSTAPIYSASGAGQLVADVRIVGLRSTPRAKAESHLQTRRDRLFDAEVVQADVRRLELSGLFANVRTYTEPGPQGMIVTFEVLERPTIGYVKFVGNYGLSHKALERQVGLKVGDPINLYSVEEGRRKIEELYREKGYRDVEVVIREGGKPSDGGVVYLIGEGQQLRIWDVEFVGNTIASDSRLLTQIESKPGYAKYFIRGLLDEQKINEDIDRLTAYYRNLGFFQARIGREIKFGDSGQWATVTFFIDEGPRYKIRSVSFAGNQKFASDDLTGLLKMKPGEYFNAGQMNRDVQELTDLYGSQGHIFANVTADPRFLEEPGQLDLVYNVQEGEIYRVGKINVHIGGEYPHTRRSVVLNRVSMRPGEIIDIRQMRASERRLKASQLFENDPTRGEAPRIVIRPPELDHQDRALAGQGAASVRGQSPDVDAYRPPAMPYPPQPGYPPAAWGRPY